MPHPTPAYTLGATLSYDHALVHDPVTKKIGYRAASPDWPDGYEGGWVWTTPEAARSYWETNRAAILAEGSAKDFSVYELQLPDIWNKCVSILPAADGVHRLLVDSRILRKVDSLEPTAII